MLKNIFLIVTLLFIGNYTLAQSYSVSGHVNNLTADVAKQIHVKVQGTEKETTLDEFGDFLIGGLSSGSYFISFAQNDEVITVKQFIIKEADFNLGSLDLDVRGVDDHRDDDTPSSSEERLDDEITSNVASVLNSGRDAFTQMSGFNWNTFRFRNRGYGFGSEHLQINNLPFNDVETDNPRYSSFSGLNNIFNFNRTSFNGINYTTTGFGTYTNFGNIDIRASKQRKQKLVSYMFGNRNAENRVMATWNTGILKNGWAFTVSGSKRFGDDAAYEGTYFDGYSYFVGVEKLIRHHSLSLSVFGSQSESGRSSPAMQELYDLAGTIRYNPNWGYQNGKKRNANISTMHIPTAILTHEWKNDNKTSIISSVAYQKGYQGFTMIDRYRSNDPRPTYYRYLPSYYYYQGTHQDSVTGDLVKQQILNNPDLLQINWNEIYQQNYNAPNGGLARFVLGNALTDMNIFTVSTVLDHTISQRVQINGGANFKMQKSHNYKEIQDLLGAKYFINYDDFLGSIGQELNPNAGLNNIDEPLTNLGVGDKYGYNYDMVSNRANAFVQTQFVFSKVDFFIGGRVSYTQFYRYGYYRNSLFANGNDSKGKSEVFTFVNPMIKGGFTYKMNGRNYFIFNGLYGSEPAEARNIFLSERTRNQTLKDFYTSDLNEKIMSGEATYLFRSPFVKARVTGYYTQLDNKTIKRVFWNDDAGTMTDYTTAGVNMLHQGVEMGAEFKLPKGFVASIAGNYGNYSYTNRPTSYLTDDRNNQLLSTEVNYIKGYQIANTPQQAYGAGITYFSKNFWRFGINVNYVDDFYYDIAFSHRTAETADNVPYESNRWNTIVDQEKQKAQFTLDVNGGWSKRFTIGYSKNEDGSKGSAIYNFLRINFGINNVLNNKTIRTLGFEQMRYDYEQNRADKFLPKYTYQQGISYYIMAAYQF